jgi:hypothetical protein
MAMPQGAGAQLFPDLGGQRAGISALSFLKINVSPRVAGMGGAAIAADGDPYALRWNPAAITDLDDWSFAASNTFWYAGLNHGYFSAAKPFEYFGTVGFTATALNSGAMKKRTEFRPDGNGQYFYANNVALGGHYAKQLTRMFSFGASVKYVNETLAEYSAHTVMADLGFLYRTDFQGLKFAASVKNFGPNSKLIGNERVLDFTDQPIELEAYPAPTVFSIGVSFLPIDKQNHRLLTMAQLNHPNDNAESLRFGAEYVFHDLLFARAGYKLNVDHQPLPTFGAGFRTTMGRHPIQIDYAVDPHPYMGLVHRVGISLRLNRASRSDGASGRGTTDNEEASE